MFGLSPVYPQRNVTHTDLREGRYLIDNQWDHVLEGIIGITKRVAQRHPVNAAAAYDITQRYEKRATHMYIQTCLCKDGVTIHPDTNNKA